MLKNEKPQYFRCKKDEKDPEYENSPDKKKNK